MRKVVLGAPCFGLSRKAMVLLLEMGFPLSAYSLESSGWTENEFDIEWPSGIRVSSVFDGLLLRDGMVYQENAAEALRSHPALVKVVQELGSGAAAERCALKIETLEGDEPYKILASEDGHESVLPMRAEFFTEGYAFEDVSLPTCVVPDEPKG